MESFRIPLAGVDTSAPGTESGHIRFHQDGGAAARDGQLTSQLAADPLKRAV
jgi:hypothetical protein